MGVSLEDNLVGPFLQVLGRGLLHQVVELPGRPEMCRLVEGR